MAETKELLALSIGFNVMLIISEPACEREKRRDGKRETEREAEREGEKRW